MIWLFFPLLFRLSTYFSIVSSFAKNAIIWQQSHQARYVASIFRGLFSTNAMKFYAMSFAWLSIYNDLAVCWIVGRVGWWKPFPTLDRQTEIPAHILCTAWTRTATNEKTEKKVDAHQTTWMKFTWSFQKLDHFFFFFIFFSFLFLFQQTGKQRE